ncbi:ganglioside GM2 activator-like [Anneissia japonica]|uniref:ganglioside GM2 activator-like n=1 Tax=Anneissia japonica TaxID=1529436 RepID=UPI001425A549|nr:ganglioside GM2 activator-like [Anneissia japonica]XP_033102006.1 ganglioside GM2 activator-like [Anneissia japonica]
MEAAKCLGFLVFLGSVMCITGFSWAHCKGHSHQKGLTFKRFKMTPDPIILPGTIHLQFDIEVTRDITPPLSLEVKLWKMVKLFWFTKKTRIYGCCSYEKICHALGTGHKSFSCPNDFLTNCIDCTCPPAPGLYNTSKSSVAIEIDDIPSYAHIFASGKFEAQFVLKDGNGQVVECLDMKLAIKLSGRKRRALPSKGTDHAQQTLNTMPKYCYPPEVKEFTTTGLPVTDELKSLTTIQMLPTFEEDHE